MTQSELGLENTVIPETQMNLYGDSKALDILAGLFNLVQRHKDIVVYFLRNDNDGFDFAFFHGTSNPINFNEFAEIRKGINKARVADTYKIQSIKETTDECLQDNWKLKNLFSIRSSGKLVVMSANSLGLGLAEIVCKKLCDTNEGHTHFDDWSTQDSIELIIRNKDTDMIFQ